VSLELLLDLLTDSLSFGNLQFYSHDMPEASHLALTFTAFQEVPNFCLQGISNR